MATRERCKACQRFNPVGFVLPEDVWLAAVPEEFRTRVLCIVCFDVFATENGVVWDDDVEFWPVAGARHVADELAARAV